MSAGNWQQPLSDAASRTFEELCFLFPTPLTDEQREAPMDSAVCVRFTGPATGHVIVRVGGGILGMLTSNMLGEDDADAGMQRDALAEVANVVCGNVLPMVAGADAAFALEAPRSINVTDITRTPDAYVELGLEDIGRAEVLLLLDAA